MHSTLNIDEKQMGEISAGQIKRLARYLKPYKKQVFLTVILMFTATITGLVGPFLLRRVIDNYIPEKNFTGIIGISMVFICAIGVTYICDRLKITTANRIGRNVLFDIRCDLFNHIQSLSLDFFDRTSTGRIIVCIINDVNRLNDLFTNGIVNVITELSMIVVAAILMIAIHPRLALLTFSTVPIFVMFLILIRNSMINRWREVRNEVSDLNAYIHESIVGMRVIQAYVRQDVNKKKFHNVLDNVFISWMRAVILNNGFGPLVNMVSALGTILIYWYGSYLLRIDGVTVGVLVAFTSYLNRFWDPIKILSNFYNQLLMAMASSERIFMLMDTKPQIYNLPDAKKLAPIKENISFNNVSFTYDHKKMVLKNISFEVKAGETIALVGPTGCGKTTIISLLSRFYDPTEGNITIDGNDIRYVTLESLRKRIGVMLQEPFIFSGTIMENIKYGRLNATDDEVIKVAKAVNAHDFIMHMENGYRSIVNERGAGLSIGQKQLIAFARVLLADPDILILDEATSSVDTHTEILLQNAVSRLLKGRTSFVIAHRLSTIRNADRIMVIEDGRIAEMGIHDQLIDKKGLYYQLYTVQYEYLNAM